MTGRSKPCSFLPRIEYGRYLGTILSEAALSGGKSRLHWKRDEARAISATGDGKLEIQLPQWCRIFGGQVVLALGNFPSSDPNLPGRDPASRFRPLPRPIFF